MARRRKERNAVEMRGSALMSFAAAQRELARLYPGWGGPAGQKLKRYAFRKERGIKKRFVVRLPGQKRQEYRVTWDILRKNCPELFPQRRATGRLPEDVLRMLDEYVSKRISEIVEKNIAPQIAELWNRDLELESRITGRAQSDKSAVVQNKRVR